MNSPDNPSDPLESITRLASRLLDGDLGEEEMGELTELLQTTPGGQEHFILLCELHAMLESERAIRSELGSAQAPGNVVPLHGSAIVSIFPTGASESSLPKRAISRHARLAWMSGLAAAFGLAALSFWVVLKRAPDTNLEDRGVATIDDAGLGKSAAEPPSGERTPDDENPESQYERAVLASLGAGSQKRPPTPFAVEPSSTGSLTFNRHIRPILSDNCFSCHGPDEASRKAGLRLDTHEGAIGGEAPVVVAGNPDASELVARILASEADDLMPPPESHKVLTSKQIDLLRQWIAEGAVWEEHWSFVPISSVLPEVTEGHHPVDSFVDRELAVHGLVRSPETDRATLIRRAALDLTGLPPTPEEIASFLASPDPDAYEAVLDEWLSRPSFGEHRARYWLDAARYGDTHGLHLDNYREIWPYRDWVIRAFTENMPFDRFTIEQLAGDLLPEATQDQRVATGFNRCNVTTSEGGAIEEEFLVRYAVDRVATTATVWMGLTAGCAQCHDHKFDPITMQDFYSLYAYFNNTTQPGMDGNSKDSAPVIRVYESPQQEEAASGLRAKIAEVEKRATTALAEYPVGDATLASISCDYLDHGKEEVPTDLEEGNFGKSDSFTVAFRFALPESEGKAVLLRRTDADDNGRGWSVVWENQGILVEFTEESPGKSLKSGLTRRFKAGASGHFAFSYDGSGRSNGIRLYHNGDPAGSRFVNQWHDSLVDDFKTERASLLVGGKDSESGLVPGITDFVLFERRLVDEEVKQLSSYPAVRTIDEKRPWDTVPEKEKEEWRRFLATWHPGTYRDALDELAELRTALSRIESATATTLVMAEKAETPKAHLLLRGEYEQKGEEVHPAVPAFLNRFGADVPANRLGLAEWLVHPEHPLTARIAVNRIWQELFGTGLVKTSDDFGTQGESPSHPELLDYLAATFVKSGWDVKALYRTIMLSETYRQSSVVPEGMAKRDPENRLLTRGPRFRLDAEVIRDQALAASGLIDPTIGGPSVKPYQPAGIWEAVGYTNSNTQTFRQDFGPSAEHRRSVYTFWKRTAHAPNLAILDAPNRESCVMRRERTNTPLQALVLMNDPQYVRASRYLALRVLGEENERDRRLDRMAELLRGRPLTESERVVVVNSLDQFRNSFDSDPAAAAELLVDEVNDSFSITPLPGGSASELAAWTMVANQLQNLDEVLNKN